MPVMSAFCSPDKGVRGVEVTFGWVLGAERFVCFLLLLDALALLAGDFFEVTLLDLAVVVRGFAVVLVVPEVVFLVVRVAIKSPH